MAAPTHRAQWQREVAFVADSNARASDPIDISVGGVPMTTTSRATLSHGDTMLAAMFSGRHKIHTDAQVWFLFSLLAIGKTLPVPVLAPVA